MNRFLNSYQGSLSVTEIVVCTPPAFGAIKLFLAQNPKQNHHFDHHISQWQEALVNATAIKNSPQSPKKVLDNLN